MATSFYFNNFTNSMEQHLIEDLVIESIRIYGHDIFYCPRTLISKDDIYGEDDISEYNKAYMMEMYIRSYDSYQGDGTFLSKFNLEIRDQITFTVSVRVYNQEVGEFESSARPKEGDLIYLPMADRLFIISYVNKTPVFYQMGAIQMYDIVADMFEYSGERLRTGIDAIDVIEKQKSINMTAYGLLTQNGFVITDQDGYDIIQGSFNLDVQTQDVFSDNEEFQTEGQSILDWSTIDPFSEGDV